MLLVWTERTYVARGVVDEAVAHHFVFAFKAFTSEGPGAAFYWAKMRSVLGVHIGVRAGIC